MKLNIAHLDKTMLLQTLYRHASPKGYGATEYARLLEAGEEVGNMSARECVKILRKAEKSPGDYIVDYYNGKPLKLKWERTSYQRVVMHSVPYDHLHGRYRFLEALLDVFPLGAIRIIDREYSAADERVMADLPVRGVETRIEELLGAAVLVTDAEGNMDWCFYN